MNGRHLVAVRVGAMGDVLHALPAVAALRRTEPAWGIGWVVDPRWAPLLTTEAGESPLHLWVHRAETKLWRQAPWSGATRRSVVALRRDLRAGRYKDVVDLQGTLRSAVLGWFAGAERLAGYVDPRERAASWFYSQRLARRGAHVVEQGAALLGEALGLALLPVPAELPREPAAESWAADWIGADRVCVLAPSAGWGRKQWPAESYAALAAALAASGLRVLVNAARQDDAPAAEVVALSQGSARMVVCGVAALVALLRRAALTVGGDSGPVHLAAALGTPLVGLYGPTDPARNGPWGPGPKRVLRHPASVTTYKRVAEVDPGLAQISVREVLRAIEDIT